MSSEKWFEQLLRLFPRRFRERHGASMQQVFEAELAESREERSLGRFWMHTLGDVFRTAPREHLRILATDVRLAVRGMRKSLLLSSTAVLTLAIGIGANATLFGVVNASLLAPLPFGDDERLVRLYVTRDDEPPLLSPSNPILFEELARQGEFFEAVVAQRFTNFTVSLDEGPERIAGLAVTRDWLDVIDVALYAGRGFSPEEETEGRDSGVALVSHGFWTRRLGARREAVGSARIRIDDRPHTVIGVLPPGFEYPYDNELWIPLNLERERDGVWGFNIQARLRPGVSLEEARAELRVLSGRLEDEHAQILRGMHLTAIPIREVLLGDGSGLVVLLLAAVGFVLLLVAVNVGNLLLARTLARQGEIALRTALGASRSRQARQILSESMTLAVAGGAIGLLFATWLSSYAGVLLPERMGRLIDRVSIDGTVVAFTVVVTLVTGLLFGAAPAIRATGTGLSDILKSGGRGGPPRQRLAVSLVVAEIALAVVVLSAAFALVSHYLALSRQSLGYEGDKIVLATLPLDRSPYTEGARRTAFIEEALERVEATPGVAAAGATCLFPSHRGNFVAEIAVEGRPIDPETRITLNHRLVTPRFFAALDLPLLKGRYFDASDDADAPRVAVISESAAARFFPGEDPVGRRVRSLRVADEDAWITIVGVTADVREFWQLDETWYLPFAQHADTSVAGQAVFAVRTTLSADAVFGPLRATLRDVDPTLPVFDLESVTELHRAGLASERLSATLSLLFAGFGLLMAALGIGGVMAYTVGQRAREYGLRAALGARPSDLLLSVLRRGAVWTASGIGIGLALSLLLERPMASLVPGLSGLALPIVLAIVLAASAVALFSCYLPARRAVRVNPLVMLRESGY